MRQLTSLVYTAIALFFCLTLRLHAQNPGPNFQAMRKLDVTNRYSIPPSPGAASLGAFGDVNVSHHTGALSFSIPLATIGDGGQSWSSALGYDGGGIKVDELPSQIGQGWALNGIGVITRTVQGHPDTKINYYDAAKHWVTSPTANNDQFKENDFLDSLSRNLIETQPDVYTFNFGSYSGSFHLTQSPIKVFFRDSIDLKITPTFDANNNILTFQIVDAGGFIYDFDFPEVTKVNMDVDGWAVPYQYNSAWY